MSLTQKSALATLRSGRNLNRGTIPEDVTDMLYKTYIGNKDSETFPENTVKFIKSVENNNIIRLGKNVSNEIIDKDINDIKNVKINNNTGLKNSMFLFKLIEQFITNSIEEKIYKMIDKFIDNPTQNDIIRLANKLRDYIPDYHISEDDLSLWEYNNNIVFAVIVLMLYNQFTNETPRSKAPYIERNQINYWKLPQYLPKLANYTHSQRTYKIRRVKRKSPSRSFKRKSSSRLLKRKAPSNPAKEFKIGIKKKGNDGKMWKVIKTLSGKRWIRS